MKTNRHNQVWLLSHSYFPARGGIENYLSEVARILLEQGYRPTIICRRQRPGLAKEEEIAGVRVIRHPDFPVPRNKLFSKHLFLTDQLSSWLREKPFCREGWAICRYPHYQYALSSLPNRCPAFYLPGAIWPIQARLAVSGRGIKERFFAWKAVKQVATLEKHALATTDRIVVFSHNMRSQMKNFYAIDPSQVVINPPGVDTDRFRPGNPNPELEASLNLRSGTPRILYLGRLSPEKNLIFLIRSLSALLKQNRALLLIVGDGSAKRTVKQEADHLRCSHSIRMVNATSQPQMYYSISDVFISPSLYEPFGQNILEAMASGLPVIALRSSPPRILTAAEEIIEEGVSGYTIAADPDHLRAKVEELLSSPQLRARMGQRGREICGERFTWERHCRRLLALFAAGSYDD